MGSSSTMEEGRKILFTCLGWWNKLTLWFLRVIQGNFKDILWFSWPNNYRYSRLPHRCLSDIFLPSSNTLSIYLNDLLKKQDNGTKCSQMFNKRRINKLFWAWFHYGCIKSWNQHFYTATNNKNEVNCFKRMRFMHWEASKKK